MAKNKTAKDTHLLKWICFDIWHLNSFWQCLSLCFRQCQWEIKFARGSSNGKRSSYQKSKHFHICKYIFFAISSFPIIEKKDQGQTAPLPFFFGFQGQPKIWPQFNKESLCAHYKYSDELSKIDAKNNGLKLILLEWLLLGFNLWSGLPHFGGFDSNFWILWPKRGLVQ